MRRLSSAALFIGVLLQAASCSRQQEPLAQPSERENPTFWESAKYPLRIDFRLPKELPMRVNDYNRDWIHVEVDFTAINIKEDPDIETGIFNAMIDIEFFSKQEYFVKNFSVYDPSLIKDAMVGNIPAIRYSHTDHMLLIPGQYVKVTSGWGGHDCERYAAGKERADCETSQQHRELVLSSFHWTKPIDTSSKEFHDWKVHILSLIEKARQSTTTKSSLSP
ncbi:MAG: hypothetical protein AABZ44_02665 [Elusimicrobiota bacterium]